MRSGALATTKGTGLSIHAGRLRIIVSALAGAVAAAAPYLLFYLGYTGQGERIYDGLLPTFTLTASALLAALVITLLRKARPWGYGVTGAAIVAILSAVGWGFVRHDINAGFSVSSAGFVFMFTFLAGMAGASVAALVSRPLLRERADGKPKRVRPWHIGAAVLLVELVFIGVAAAVGF